MKTILLERMLSILRRGWKISIRSETSVFVYEIAAIVAINLVLCEKYLLVENEQIRYLLGLFELSRPFPSPLYFLNFLLNYSPNLRPHFSGRFSTCNPKAVYVQTSGKQ